MRKTTSYPSSSSDALSVDTAGLQKMLNSGRQTASHNISENTGVWE